MAWASLNDLFSGSGTMTVDIQGQTALWVLDFRLEYGQSGIISKPVCEGCSHEVSSHHNIYMVITTKWNQIFCNNIVRCLISSKAITPVKQRMSRQTSEGEQLLAHHLSERLGNALLILTFEADLCCWCWGCWWSSHFIS